MPNYYYSSRMVLCFGIGERRAYFYEAVVEEEADGGGGGDGGLLELLGGDGSDEAIELGA